MSNSLNEKLVEYRKKRIEQSRREKVFAMFTSVKNILTGNKDETEKKEVEYSTKIKINSKTMLNKETLCKPLLQNFDKPKNIQVREDIDLNDDENDKKPVKHNHLVYFTYVLYFSLWVTLYIVAIEVGFGTVYLILSLLVFIYLNTESRVKLEGEPSAYSVFNPNCEAIEGTLDASQFESEIRYGIGSLH